MLEVHAPHERIGGLRDFFIHLFTITVGLLIALSLEGCVEWQHHRHLVREAESGLRNEIEQNSKLTASIRQQIQDEQKLLDQDLLVLSHMRIRPGPTHETLGFSFTMRSFDEVTWKTAQATGAFAYMPYNDARQYSDIYGTQETLFTVQQQVVDDVMRAASVVVTQPQEMQLPPATIAEVTDRIGMVKMRLNLLDSLVNELDKTYQKYRSDHR